MKRLFKKLSKKIIFILSALLVAGASASAAWPACHRYAQALAGKFDENWRIL